MALVSCRTHTGQKPQGISTGVPGTPLRQEPWVPSRWSCRTRLPPHRPAPSAPPAPGLCKAARAGGAPALLFSRSCLGSRTQLSPLPGSLPPVLSRHPPAPVRASGVTLLCAHLLPSPGRGLSQFRPPTPGPPRTQAGMRHEEQHPPGSQEHPRMKGSHRGEQAIMQTQGTNR